jgi:hypothetical protein
MIPGNPYQIEKQVKELATLISARISGIVICACRNDEEIKSIRKMLISAPNKIAKFDELVYEANQDLIELLRENSSLDDDTIMFINKLEKIANAKITEKLELLEEFLVSKGATTIIWLKEQDLPRLMDGASYSWLINSKLIKFYRPQEITKPIIFISYVNEDSNFVYKLYSKLLNYDLVVSVYETDMILKNIDDRIFKYSSNTLVFMPVLSSYYISSKFRKKLNTILSRFESYSYTRIIPIRIHRAQIPDELAQYVCIDLDDNLQQGFDNLLKELGVSPLKIDYKVVSKQRKIGKDIQEM